MCVDPSQPHPYNHDLRIRRDVGEMLGLVRGLLADGVLLDSEIHSLHRWMHGRPDVLLTWAGGRVAHRLERIFADGRIDEEERADLSRLLHELVGQDASGAVEWSGPTTLPLDTPPPDIDFDGRTFVFTGAFAFGPRRACERITTELGGVIHSGVRLNTDILVIGSFGSSDWIQSAWGRKIQRAMELRERGRGPFIVAEDHWAQAIP